MELFYNELSQVPVSNNKYLANQKVTRFIDCYKTILPKGFSHIRFSKQFHEIEIAGGYTLANWLNETSQRNYKDLILGARTFPFIKADDVWAEDEYIKHQFFFENIDPPFERSECMGLAAAQIYDSISISFSGTPIWEKNALNISKVNEETQSSDVLEVTNIFSADCSENEVIKLFIERVSEIVLIPSNLQPLEKTIQFRDDHGTDVLNAFARRIRNSPYVSGIVNSLPWNSQSSNFIRRVYPTGLIEVVLYWTDNGLGMVIQTTGRNLRETEEIARLLEEEYT
jgi:hypothetical protein